MAREDDVSTYCAEWKDNERMAVLFAPLRSKQLNPESWNSKIQFWSSLIIRWAQHNNQPVVSLDQLEQAFQRAGKSPYCLEDVLQECWVQGQVVDLSRYLGALQPRPTWGSWLKGVGVSAMQTVGETITGFRPNDDMVIPEVADRLSRSALQQLKIIKPVVNLKNWKFLYESDVKKVINTEGLVIQFLQAKKQIASVVIDGQKFYKISAGDDLVNFDETDVGIIKMQQTLGHLREEIEGLEKEIGDLEAKVRQSIKNGSRTMAKNHLKKQKMLEANLEKQFTQLHNIESILEGIISAETNKKVVESYRSGLDALKTSMSSHNLDDVDILMDDIGETISKGEGLSFMLARTNLEDSTNMEELERELEDLSEDLVDKPAAIVGRKENQDLLFELEKLTVHDSTLEPVIKQTGMREGGSSPVAL